MKQVLNITLGGTVFACESDAYDVLSLYLKSIEDKFSGSEDCTDIISDIEHAIAEKCIRRKRSERVAVTHTDIKEIITELGSVTEIDEEETDHSVPTSKPKAARKQLFRDAENSVLGGVASGIAAYFDIDPVIVRVLFFASLFLNGLGLIIYILLWIIVPEAETSADRFAMRGEAMTLEKISKKITKNIRDLDTKKMKDTAGSTWGGVRPILVSFFEFFGSLATIIFHSLRYIIGIVLVIIGALATAAIVASTVVITTGSSLLHFDPFLTSLISHIFTSSVDGLLLLVSASLVLIIPVLVIIIIGASFIRGKNAFTIGNAITLFLVWMISIMLVSFIGASFSPKQLEFLEHANNQQTACTLESKICPDGSVVGRTGPSCEFSECPALSKAEKDGLISVETPLRGEKITSPLTVRGEARGYWFFEGSFPIIVVDWDGRIIGEGFATAEGEWMTESFVPFSGTITFSVPTDTPYLRGAIIFKKDNPSDLPEHDDALEVPVIF